MALLTLRDKEAQMVCKLCSVVWGELGSFNQVARLWHQAWFFWWVMINCSKYSKCADLRPFRVLHSFLWYHIEASAVIPDELYEDCDGIWDVG